MPDPLLRRAQLHSIAGAMLAWTLGPALPVAARPAEVPSSIARKARAIIDAQLAAFAADDAKRAFSYAAPNIRQLFGDADTFLAMVRKSYPMVYRPSSHAFLNPTMDGDALVQRVQFSDADGVGWTAVYRLERQPDDSWRISACQVMNGQGRFV